MMQCVAKKMCAVRKGLTGGWPPKLTLVTTITAITSARVRACSQTMFLVSYNSTCYLECIVSLLMLVN